MLKKVKALATDSQGRAAFEVSNKHGSWCLKPACMIGVDARLGEDGEEPGSPWPLAEAKKVWEALGSDHNSGYFAYGPASAIRSWWDAHVPEALIAKLDDCDEEDAPEPCAARWDFVDGNSVAIVWGEEYGQVADIGALSGALPSDCVGSVFGAFCDDVLIHEILAAAVNGLLPEGEGACEDELPPYGDIPKIGGAGAAEAGALGQLAAAYCALMHGVLSKSACKESLEDSEACGLVLKAASKISAFSA